MGHLLAQKFCAIISGGPMVLRIHVFDTHGTRQTRRRRNLTSGTICCQVLFATKSGEEKKQDREFWLPVLCLTRNVDV